MNNNNVKKTWQKPEVKDLDVKDTTSATTNSSGEASIITGRYGPQPS